MITLIVYPSAMGLPSPSPFCVKAETWLRMTGLDHKVEYVADPRKTPKKKLPVIEDAGRTVADSGFIIEHLKATHGVDPDAHLSAAERAHALGLTRLIEEHLYWCIVHMRWIDETCWPAVRDIYFSHLPAPVRWFLPGMLRRLVRKQLHGHGMGRHSQEEIYQLAATNLQALADALGDRPYFGGDRPATLDAVAFAFVANLLVPDLEGPPKAAAAGHANLVAHMNRMKEKCFADWTPPA